MPATPVARGVKGCCVRKCQSCVPSKLPQPKIRVPVKPFLATPLLEVAAVNFTNVFTKFTQVFPTQDQKADTTAKILLKEWSMRYGVPERLHCDQNFEIAVIPELRKLYGVVWRKHASPPQSPRECSVWAFELGNAQPPVHFIPERKRRWPEHLPELICAYNMTPYVTTGYSPYYLLLGVHPYLPLDALLGKEQISDGEKIGFQFIKKDCVMHIRGLVCIQSRRWQKGWKVTMRRRTVLTWG